MEFNKEAMEVEKQQRKRWNNVGERARSGGSTKVKVKTHGGVKIGSTTSVLGS